MINVKSVNVAYDNGETHSFRVTSARSTWRKLALRHVRDLEAAGVPPGGHGFGLEGYSVIATMSDGRLVDVTARFVGDGWAAWLEADWDARPEHVPAAQPLRLRRSRAFWAMPEPGVEDREAEKEYELACIAEGAGMATEAAA